MLHMVWPVSRLGRLMLLGAGLVAKAILELEHNMFLSNP